VVLVIIDVKKRSNKNKKCFKNVKKRDKNFKKRDKNFKKLYVFLV